MPLRSPTTCCTRRPKAFGPHLRAWTCHLDFGRRAHDNERHGRRAHGTGYSEGENRAVTAADNAIHSPLLDDVSIVGAKGILINITGGEDITLYDVNDATQTIYDAVGEDVETNIIFGAVTDATMNGKIRVTVIATGFSEEKLERRRRIECRETHPEAPWSEDRRAGSPGRAAVVCACNRSAQG